MHIATGWWTGQFCNMLYRCLQRLKSGPDSLSNICRVPLLRAQNVFLKKKMLGTQKLITKWCVEIWLTAFAPIIMRFLIYVSIINHSIIILHLSVMLFGKKIWKDFLGIRSIILLKISEILLIFLLKKFMLWSFKIMV